MSAVEQFMVKRIIDKRIRRNKVEYLLSWDGYGEEDNTWEPVANLDCPDLIKLFEQNYQPQSSKRQMSQKNTHRSILQMNECSVQACDSTTSELTDDRLMAFESKNTSFKVSEESDQENVSLVSLLEEEEKHDANEKSGNLIKFPEEILGASNQNGQLSFLFKWLNTNDVELVPAKIANEKYPHHVIHFYEKHINWIIKK